MYAYLKNCCSAHCAVTGPSRQAAFGIRNALVKSMQRRKNIPRKGSHVPLLGKNNERNNNKCFITMININVTGVRLEGQMILGEA